MNKFIIGALALFCTQIYAAKPSKQYITETLVNPYILGVTQFDSDIFIESTTEVYLLGGEVAYLTSASLPNAGRNFSDFYILTRPDLKQSVILGEGSQTDKPIVRNILFNNKKLSIVETYNGDSGHGAMNGIKYLSYFNNWDQKIIDKITFDLPDTSNEVTCKGASSSKGDFTVNGLAYTKTVLKAKPCSDNFVETSSENKGIQIKGNSPNVLKYAVKTQDYSEDIGINPEVNDIPSSYKKVKTGFIIDQTNVFSRNPINIHLSRVEVNCKLGKIRNLPNQYFKDSKDSLYYMGDWYPISRDPLNVKLAKTYCE